MNMNMSKVFKMHYMILPPKTNNEPLETEIPFWKPAFSGFMFSFRECICIYTYIHAFAEEIKDDKDMLRLTKIFVKLAETTM